MKSTTAYRFFLMGAVFASAFGVSLTVWETRCAFTQDVPTESGVDELPPESRSNSASAVDSTLGESESSKDAHKENSESGRGTFDYASLYVGPGSLKKLDRSSPIWVTTDRKRVVLGGVVCLRDGWLEFFACRSNSKEHESIIALETPPHLIHAALLAIGAKQGAPAKYDPEFVPPSGDEINIDVCWRDSKDGKICRRRAQEMIRDEKSGKTMASSWVFTGGLFGVDPDGKKYYLANVTGEVFGVSNFPGSVLDVPYESSSDNSRLSYVANTEKIPDVNTNVVLILSLGGKDDTDSPERTEATDADRKDGNWENSAKGR